MSKFTQADATELLACIQDGAAQRGAWREALGTAEELAGKLVASFDTEKW